MGVFSFFSVLRGYEDTHLIHILPPLRVKYWPQGERTAVVLMEAASDPLAGSVRQKAATFSPTKNMQGSISKVT